MPKYLLIQRPRVLPPDESYTMRTIPQDHGYHLRTPEAIKEHMLDREVIPQVRLNYKAGDDLLVLFPELLTAEIIYIDLGCQFTKDGLVAFMGKLSKSRNLKELRVGQYRGGSYTLCDFDDPDVIRACFELCASSSIISLSGVFDFVSMDFQDVIDRRSRGYYTKDAKRV